MEEKKKKKKKKKKKGFKLKGQTNKASNKA